MRVRLTQHGIERLFTRVQKKAQDKSYFSALSFINKVIEKGIITANDAKQMLVLYANNLYIFKKEIESIAFITVKTTHENRLEIYIRGQRNTFHTRKNFQLCA